MVGLEAAIRLLQGQMAQGVSPRAYLFFGPDGIGKRTLALAFAQALQAEVAQTGQPGLPIKIDEIRDLERRVSLTPFHGRWKVGLVDGAERLTEEAVHACLKILEEPPERTIFILITAAPHALPATVTSRCVALRCVPQGVERVSRHLQEKEALDPAEARRLAVGSGGRLGLALQLHRTGALAAKNGRMDQILAALKARRLEIPLGKGSREEALEALEWYAAWCRDLLVLALGGSPDWLIHQDRLEELNRPSSPGVRPEQAVHPSTNAQDERRVEGRSTIVALLERIDRTYRIHEAIGRNANLRTALGALLSS